jgi:tetratricopeptide (TPR) repeat protein
MARRKRRRRHASAQKRETRRAAAPKPDAPPQETETAPRQRLVPPRLPLWGAVVFLTLVFTLSYFWNEDFWWYLASGEAILAEGAIPEDDPFLYPEENRGRWITHSWLWTVLAALIHRGFGMPGEVATGAILGLVIVTLVFTSGRLDRYGLLNGVAAAAALWTLNHRLSMKAELASWVLLLVYFRLLDGGRRFTWRTGALLAALHWLWSNFHGGYPLGLVAVTAYAAGGWLRKRFGKQEDNGSEEELKAPPLWLVAVLAAVSLATPSLAVARLRVLGALVGLGGDVEGLPDTFISEWQATFAGPWDLYAGMYVALAAVAVFGFLVSRSPQRLARLLLLAAMAVLGFNAVRFVPGFVLLSAAICLANLAQIAPGQRRWWTPSTALGTASYILCCALLGLGLVATAAGVSISKPDFEVGQSSGVFLSLSPLSTAPGAADFVLRHKLPPPIFNDMFLGGYLIHRLYPDYRLFIDNRNLSDKLLGNYSQVLSSRQHWQRAEQRYGFRTVILTTVYTRGLLRDMLAADPRWRLVYLDPTAVIFVRGDAPTPKIQVRGAAGGENSVPFLAGDNGWMRRLGHRFLRTDPASLLNLYLSTLGGLGQLEAVEALASEALDQRPELSEVRWLRGTARLHRGNVAAARRDMEEAIRQGAGGVEARLQYAFVLYRLREPEEALHQLEEASREAPDNSQVEQMLRRIRAELGR